MADSQEKTIRKKKTDGLVAAVRIRLTEELPSA
jgi:hypothetical protein